MARLPVHSLTQRLLLYLLVPVLVIIIIAVGIAVRSSSHSINALFDQKMQNGAEILMSFLLYELKEHAGEEEGSEQEESDDEDEDEDEEQDFAEEIIEAVNEIESQQGITVNYRLKLGKSTIFTSGKVQPFPACNNGFSNFEMISSTNSGEKDRIFWRCYRQSHVLSASGEPIIVEFFEQERERKQALQSLILIVFLPVFCLPLLLVVVTFWAVNRAMESLRGICVEISNRSVDNLERLSSADQPSEFLPVVDSINGLLNGIERGVAREKQFTEDAAHELRTPLTSIKMLEQLLRRANRDAALERNLDNLRDSVEQSSNLIEQLLSFSRLQTSNSLPKGAFFLLEAIRVQLGLLSPQLTEKFLGVDISAHEELSPMQASEPAMYLLLNNLLINAIKFSPTGGTLYISVTRYSLSIEDDGPGIHPDHRARIFDRFYRAPGSQDTPGSGLGLALAKWVADAHGFSLSVQEPSAGTGACMVVVFSQADCFAGEPGVLRSQ